MSYHDPYTKANLEAALAYSRWLHMAEFTKTLNVHRRQFGLPVETPPVCLNSVGKHVYEAIRKGIQNDRSPYAAVPLIEAERKEVVAEIIRGLNRRVK